MTAPRRLHDATLTGLALLLAAGAAVLAGCRQVDPEVTGIRIATSWSSSTAIDQLAFELHTDDSMLGPRELRPQIAGGPLSPGADVVVYLSDVHAGRWLRAVVLGLSGGQVVASGEGRVAVTASAVIDVTVSLDGSTPPPPLDGGGVPDGGVKLDGGMNADGPGDGGPGDTPPAQDTSPTDLRDLAPPSDRPAVPLPNGQPCSDKLACASGQCTDGVCCESAGCGSCRSCNVPGMAGTCRAVAAGQMDPRGTCAMQPPSSCGLNGKCDGSGGCQRYPMGTVCDTTRCHSSGEGVVKDDHCDGAGTCVNAGTDFCEGYKCNPTTIACYSSCTDASQCAAGRVCRGGRCE